MNGDPGKTPLIGKQSSTAPDPPRAFILALEPIWAAIERAGPRSVSFQGNANSSIRQQLTIFGALYACLANNTERLSAVIEGADESVLPVLLELLGSLYSAPLSSQIMGACVAAVCSRRLRDGPAFGRAAAMHVLADLLHAHPSLEPAMFLEPNSSLITPPLRNGDLRLRGYLVAQTGSTELQLHEWCGIVREATHATNVSM